MYLPLWVCQVLVVAHGTFSCSMWGLVPWPGIEPGPSALGVGVLATTREVPVQSFKHDHSANQGHLLSFSSRFMLTNSYTFTRRKLLPVR